MLIQNIPTPLRKPCVSINHADNKENGKAATGKTNESQLMVNDETL